MYIHISSQDGIFSFAALKIQSDIFTSSQLVFSTGLFFYSQKQFTYRSDLLYRLFCFCTLTDEQFHIPKVPTWRFNVSFFKSDSFCTFVQNSLLQFISIISQFCHNFVSTIKALFSATIWVAALDICHFLGSLWRTGGICMRLSELENTVVLAMTLCL